MQEDKNDDNFQEKNYSFDKLYEIAVQLLAEAFSDADDEGRENERATLENLEKQLQNFSLQTVSDEEKTKLSTSISIFNNIKLKKNSKLKIGDIQAIYQQCVESLHVQALSQTVQGNQNINNMFIIFPPTEPVSKEQAQKNIRFDIQKTTSDKLSKSKVSSSSYARK